MKKNITIGGRTVNVYFDDRQDKLEISQELMDSMIEVIKIALVMENQTLESEVSVSFVDNNEIQNLNSDFRGKDMPTDVLSFPMGEDEFGMEEEVILGDIVISCERALEQSADFGHSFEREMLYLTAHSILHLLGYDHMIEEEKVIMRGKEKEIMKEIEVFKN
jgi:probable rRNA maturation factor